jgi:hypothetical protein
MTKARTKHFQKAMDFLRRPDARLIKTHTSNGGCAHYIAPGGGYVDPEVAEQIKNHPLVTASEDGMWPGLSQTWRIAP